MFLLYVTIDTQEDLEIYSGYREPGCGVGTPTGYHYKGQAFDLISTKLTAKEMREILENNQDKLKYPIRVEK